MCIDVGEYSGLIGLFLLSKPCLCWCGGIQSVVCCQNLNFQDWWLCRTLLIAVHMHGCSFMIMCGNTWKNTHPPTLIGLWSVLPMGALLWDHGTFNPLPVSRYNQPTPCVHHSQPLVFHYLRLLPMSITLNSPCSSPPHPHHSKLSLYPIAFLTPLYIPLPSTLMCVPLLPTLHL